MLTKFSALQAIFSKSRPKRRFYVLFRKLRQKIAFFVLSYHFKINIYIGAKGAFRTILKMDISNWISQIGYLKKWISQISTKGGRFGSSGDCIPEEKKTSTPPPPPLNPLLTLGIEIFQMIQEEFQSKIPS